MPKLSMRCKLLTGVAGLAVCLGSVPMAAQADEVLDNVLRRLDKLEKENAALKAKVSNQAAHKKADDAVAAKAATPATPAVTPAAYQAPPLASDDGWYLHKKEGPALTFQTPGGEFGVYGQLDVSVDATTKGFQNFVVPANSVGPGPGGRPVGNVGWLPAITSNISYIGVRGFQKIPDSDFKFVYQMETLISVAFNSGIKDANNAESNVASGGLTSRNSFVGVSDKTLGALKVGKIESPYKTSTDIFNPFNGMLGDYRVIMGNTGGDNRVEFGLRLEHSIWWESPDWNGLQLKALFSPGQNRANNSDNIASGSNDCAGGNTPLSGGFTTCSDGAFSDAVSLSATYHKDGFLITTAYERHEKVNRSSDILGSAVNINPGSTLAGTLSGGDLTSAIGQSAYARDIAAEDAFKVGALYKFAATKTTIGGIWESMHRYLPSDLQFQNERQRQGTWAFITQEIGAKDEVSFGWAHAFKTPGDPGQHNDATLLTANGEFTYAPNNNEADMLTAVWKHKFSPALMWYINGAATLNGPSAHFDLGAGGHGVTTDGHDANSSPSSNGGYGSNPHTWTGSDLYGISTGVQYKF